MTAPKGDHFRVYSFSHFMPGVIGVASFQTGFYGGRESHSYVRQA